MIVLGIILLVISYVVGFAVLWTIGIILVVIASSCGSWDPSGTRSPDGGTTGSRPCPAWVATRSRTTSDAEDPYSTRPSQPSCRASSTRAREPRHHTMILFYLLLIAAIVLVIVGATTEGMLYLLSAGVLLLIADVLYLAVRSVLHLWRPAH